MLCGFDRTGNVGWRTCTRPAALVSRRLQAFANLSLGVPLQRRVLAVLSGSRVSVLVGASSAKMARPASTRRQEPKRTTRATRPGIRRPCVRAGDNACRHDPTGSVAKEVTTRGHVLP